MFVTLLSTAACAAALACAPPPPADCQIADLFSRAAADSLLDKGRSLLPRGAADLLDKAKADGGKPKGRAQAPAPQPSEPQAEAQPRAADPVPAGFTPIGTFGEFRLDGVRAGTHNDIPVRFVDFTLKNTSDVTTFADTIQSVRWQGRTSGQAVRALRPDGSPFGMHGQYIQPGQVVAVTYPIPAREDIDGVTVEYQHPGDGPKSRAWTWDELSAAGAAQ